MWNSNVGEQPQGDIKRGSLRVHLVLDCYQISSSRSLTYVKANDVWYGLKVASRDPKTSKVFRLQCHFCIAFGREEKVGSKQKLTTTVQGWSTPFCYDNIENHMRTQHPTQWAQYAAIKSDNEHDNSSPTNIIDTIVGNMLCDPADEFDNDDDVSCGASNIIGCTYDVLGYPCLRACSHQDVSKFIRVVCAINLQRIADVLRRSWGFSIALDFATHQTTSYLDLRFCVFIEEHSTIVNLHGCALPMFDRHTDEIMFDMVDKFLIMLCPDWMIHLISLASDGARNMTNRIASIVIRLDAAMHADCPLTQIWCGAHQLDLVMEHIMNDVVKERFFIIMTSFITYIIRQQKLIVDMNTTRTAIAFRSIQGLTTLLEQQQAALNDLVAFFIDDVGVTGLLTTESIRNLDTSTHVISGFYAVSISSVQEFLSVLSHELVKFAAAQYICKIRQNAFRLEHRYSTAQIDIIADEHKALIHAYRFELVLKQGIDALFGKSSFKDGWSLLGIQFPNLMDYYGVVATLFPGTSTVESNFSVLRWEKDGYHKALLDFGLEGVLQSKQYFFIQQLLH
ncbi:hypothetical protein CY35_08G042000 [Sphagnum magellanicum]|nr:hypothetical protein CY35_08G042000 [Sphagnum magellanicum]